MRTVFERLLPVLVVGLFLASLFPAGFAATTELRIVKYAADKTTILGQETVSSLWMEGSLPVKGDGFTHYYHQGPVFLDDPDETVEQQLRWNAAEDTNVKEKDMGAVKGTAVRDLCDLVGGMQPGDTVTLKAEDGMTKAFAYENVYTPTPRQGEMVLAWYRADEGYVPEYREGMRLVFLADNSTNPYGLHVFGNYDWHESAAPGYWYFYRQGTEKYPTTTGLSVQYVSEIRVYSAAAPAFTGDPAGTSPAATTSPARSGMPVTVVIVAGIGAVVLATGIRRNRQ